MEKEPIRICTSTILAHRAGSLLLIGCITRMALAFKGKMLLSTLNLILNTLIGSLVFKPRLVRWVLGLQAPRRLFGMGFAA